MNDLVTFCVFDHLINVKSENYSSFLAHVIFKPKFFCNEKMEFNIGASATIE